MRSDFGWLAGVMYGVGTAEEVSVSFACDASGNGTGGKTGQSELFWRHGQRAIR
jgi:hypothetical protein